jgi:ketosteroid isomerase-like protein
MMRGAIHGSVVVLLAVAAPLSAHESASPSTPAHALSTDAQEAASVVDAFHSALNRGDTRAAEALLANDALIFESGGVERSKAEYAETHLPADAEFSKTVSSTTTRRSGHANGAFAWIASEGASSGTYQGKTVDRITAETMILRRDRGIWRIVHIHWSSARRRG